MHVRAQNVGLIFHRSDDEKVLVHAFETSAQCGDVMQSSDRLAWHFPGQTVTFEASLLGDPHFIREMAIMISRMCHETPQICMPITKKARSKVPEERETVHPWLVTEGLMSILEGYGEAQESPVIHKHIRDDINWDSSKLPWRRSPLWLAIRVSIQILLSHLLSSSEGRTQYKNFMAFLMAKVCNLTISNEIGADIQLIAMGKVARRLSKLGNSCLEFVEEAVQSSVQAARDNLDQGWVEFQQKETRSAPPCNKTATKQDWTLSLQHSREHLLQAMFAEKCQLEVDKVTLSRMEQLQFNSDGLPDLTSRGGILQAIFQLTDFERWILGNLRSWMAERPASEQDCTSLMKMMRKYMDTAEDKYKGNSRAQSVMLLVLLESWMVLDTICVKVYPLLGQYGPGIPKEIGRPLLLPHLCHLERLGQIEDHLSKRWRESTLDYPAVHGSLTDNSFSVRFFEHSEPHRRLRDSIEHDAGIRRERKEREWNKKSAKYHRLQEEESRLIHSYGFDQFSDEVHLSTCSKCDLQSKMRSLSIRPDEWPLPADEVMLKAAVFELDCPSGIAAWRDVTWMIMQDLGRSKMEFGAPHHATLLNYHLIKPYAVDRGQRITIASRTKSFLGSHYRELHFPISLDSVLVKNGLRYSVFDGYSSCWVEDQGATPRYHPRCISSLPSGPYSNLQRFVDISSHTANEALASQQQCHHGISSHEFVAFASLRAGERIQWHNILRELGSAELSFNTQEVFILIRQAALQAGSRGANTVLRETHALFHDLSFSSRLLNLLGDHLTSIETNWKEQHRLATLALLTLRALSLGQSGDVTSQAMKLLRRVRDVALDWCRQVSDSLQTCSSESENFKLRKTILISALTCHMTFDLDFSRISVILEDSRDVARFVQSSIHIHDNLPVSLSDLPEETRHALLMAQKITRIVERRLKTLIEWDESGINDGIERACGLTGFYGRWAFVSGTHNRWATCEIISGSCGTRQLCHYDLLTGEVLLDGRRIGQLPTSYTSTTVYRRIFDSRILNVTKSHLPHMEYKTPTKIDGHEIHLGMRNGELIIESLREKNHFRLVPPATWSSDLPKPLAQDFAQWMNLTTGVVFFCSLDNPLDTSRDAPTLHFRSTGRSYMQIEKRKLVDHSSPLGKSILDTLRVLEDPLHVIITASQDTVEADVPRFRLRFFVNQDGSLESKELGAAVDKDQNIGCLFGLRNKLVLQSVSSHPNVPKRSIIIPYGSVSVLGSGNYKHVETKAGNDRKLQFMHYQIDQKLSQLRSTQGGTVPQLFLTLLHAVTGSIMPDPLTKHTGTEEALRILHQRSLRTSSPIGEDAMALLNQIASLTPKRTFYPLHLKCMQTVKWSPNLSQLAQHEDFYTLVEDLVAHSAQFSILHEGQGDYLSLEPRGNIQLLRRAANRNWTTRTTSLGSKERSDERYSTRDANTQTTRAQRVYQIAVMVRHWSRQLNVVTDLVHRVREWGQIEGYGHTLKIPEMTYNDILTLQLGQQWGSLYDLCRNSQREADQYKLLHLLGMVAFAQPEKMILVQTLLAIASSGLFRDITPSEHSYNLGLGESPNNFQIQSAVSQYCENITRQPGEARNDWARRLADFNAQKSTQLSLIVDHVISQWPCDRPTMPSVNLPLVNTTRASDACARLFTSWNKNRKFIIHIEQVQARLDQIQSNPVHLSARAHLPNRESSLQGTSTFAPTLTELLQERPAPSLLKPPEAMHIMRPKRAAKSLACLEELQAIVENMKGSPNTTQKGYANDFSSSLHAFLQKEFPETPDKITAIDSELLAHRAEINECMTVALRRVTRSLLPERTSEEVLQKAGLWPHLTIASLLSCLSASKIRIISAAWKTTLILLGEIVSLLQRSERLLVLKTCNDVVGFYKEAEEPGRRSWSSAEFPDWLLMEVENNLTIRELQAVVARKMMQARPNEANFVLQLNMGEGKSSVIVPMVVAALANGEQLARLVVLKPLLRQTENLLSQRLGGLVDRLICHLPFSRKTYLDQDGLGRLRGILDQCMKEQSVLIALPEHMMSFRLMGRERIQTEPALGWDMISTDTWLGKHCRDILDESDEILDPRFQLVYSIGGQRMMDGQPDRWIITQRLLLLFAQQARRLQPEDSQNLDIDYGNRSYPLLTFLNSAVGQTMLDLLVEDIGRGNLIGFTLTCCDSIVRQAALTFIRHRSIPADVASTITKKFHGTNLWAKLHLLRGLIAYDVLLFTIQNKRWLVNYGLDPSRSMMAVPYRAKSVPSPSAEFAHPDVAVVLTCLSYYYDGLTCTQLRQSFDLLFRESDPSSEYARWLQDCPGSNDLPPSILSLDGVNLEDQLLWDVYIYPHLRFSKAAADFFMARVVFPREGKEFPAKMSSSAWDIPSPNGGTTGFSGTNDNKPLLPTFIQQQDLPQLHHTNAMVLNLLLRPENRRYIEARDDRTGKRLDVRGLLQMVCSQEPCIQVLIDVGAQVLELKNCDVAEEWLKLAPHAEAAVYFDESDELMAVDRQGYAQRLFSSPFCQRLDSCVIYLDEVHTRGVDLRMPADARAAVTLGPRTTKDRLVQGTFLPGKVENSFANIRSACMRMRKLDSHQSLVFFSPPEVHQEILRMTGKFQDEELDSADVVQWSLVQTCRASDSIMPLWIIQGLEHSRRRRLCAAFIGTADILEDGAGPLDEERTSSFYSEIQEPECLPLEEMYGAGSKETVFRTCLTDDNARQDSTVRFLLEQWASFKEDKHKDWTLQEEQEREIAHEVEQRREIQRPPPAVALPHMLDPEVRRFVQTGTFKTTAAQSPFLRAFESLHRSSAYQHLHVLCDAVVAEDLYVTRDFVDTVQKTLHSGCDEFMRPIKWILSSFSTRVLVIISPFEANALLPYIRTSSRVRLHVYSAKVSKTMTYFSDLCFYTVSSCKEDYIPSLLLTAQLDLFAGCLFFENFAEYKTACGFLGILVDKQLDDGLGVDMGSDGFAGIHVRRALNWRVPSPFDRSPILFLKALTGIRRKGSAYASTHLGHLVSGNLLTEGNFLSV